MSLGLESGRVVLLREHRAWADEFLRERKSILKALSGHADKGRARWQHGGPERTRQADPRHARRGCGFRESPRMYPAHGIVGLRASR